MASPAGRARRLWGKVSVPHPPVFRGLPVPKSCEADRKEHTQAVRAEERAWSVKYLVLEQEELVIPSANEEA